jgi:V8-like Glu-specific endopeptidase
MKKIILSVLMTLLCLNALTARAGLDVVIGEDDRDIAPVNYPYSAIGRVTTKAGLFCTGFMVSKSVVVTNAHCVVNEQKEILPLEEIDFYLSSQQRSFTAKRVAISKNYLADQMRFDFAFIEVDQDAGHHAGYFGTRSFDISMDKKEMLQLSGYATDYKYGWELFRQTKLCRAERPSTEGLIMHTCDMHTGSSGAPLFIKVDEKFYVVGINSRESTQGACASFNDQTCFNLAVPFQQIGQELIEFQN